MPKKISSNEMRDWLDRYDSGESEAAIAKAVHRDTRTVKKCLAQARREGEAHGARVELLKNALKQHQDRMLKAIKEVESALVMPSNDLWRGYNQTSLPSQLGFIGSTLTFKEGEGWTVHLAVEDKPEWELIKEHLKGDLIWAGLNAWKKAFKSHVEARVNLEHQCTDLIRKRKFAQPPFLDFYTSLVFIYQAILHKALGTKPQKEFEEMIAIDTEKGELTAGLGWGDKPPIVTKVPGEEERFKANLLTALEDLLISEETKKVQSTYHDLEDAIKKAQRAVNEILLLEMIPGECRVCRRLGV